MLPSDYDRTSNVFANVNVSVQDRAFRASIIFREVQNYDTDAEILKYI